MERRRQFRSLMSLGIVAVLAAAVAMDGTNLHQPDKADAQGCPYTQMESGAEELGFTSTTGTFTRPKENAHLAFAGPYRGTLVLSPDKDTAISTTDDVTCDSAGSTVNLEKSNATFNFYARNCKNVPDEVRFIVDMVDECRRPAQRTNFSVNMNDGQQAYNAMGDEGQPEQSSRYTKPPAPKAQGPQSTRPGGSNSQSCARANDNSLPRALRTEGNTSIRGRWTGPNDSSPRQYGDAMRSHSEASQLIKKVRDGKATPAEAQEIADTLWLMSHEWRVHRHMHFEDRTNGKLTRFWKLLRYWVTREGLEPSEEAKTAGVPWPVFKNKCGEVFTPKEARERYGGPPEGNLGLWSISNPLSYIGKSPGGLNEVIVGPPKDHGEGKAGDKYVDTEGTWLTEYEAYQKYGNIPAGSSKAEWEAANNLRHITHEERCPGIPNPAQQQTQNGQNQAKPGCAPVQCTPADEEGDGQTDHTPQKTATDVPANYRASWVSLSPLVPELTGMPPGSYTITSETVRKYKASSKPHLNGTFTQGIYHSVTNTLIEGKTEPAEQLRWVFTPDDPVAFAEFWRSRFDHMKKYIQSDHNERSNTCTPAQTDTSSRPHQGDQTCNGRYPAPSTPAGLVGQTNLNRNAFPGIDDYDPWYRYGRVRLWRIGADISWRKRSSGYTDLAEAGRRDETYSAEYPAPEVSAEWGFRDWEKWNLNRVALGLDRVSIYRRKCDRTYLTEFQVYEMYGTPFEPRNLNDKLIDMDKWNRYASYSKYGMNILTLQWDDASGLDWTIRKMEEAGTPITRENVIAEVGKGRFRYGWQDLVWGETEKVKTDRSPQVTHEQAAGNWTHLGIDLSRESHGDTRTKMAQAIGRVNRAGQAMTMVNFVQEYVDTHYDQGRRTRYERLRHKGL